jgi:hypothetical protein
VLFIHVRYADDSFFRRTDGVSFALGIIKEGSMMCTFMSGRKYLWDVRRPEVVPEDMELGNGLSIDTN